MCNYQHLWGKWEQRCLIAGEQTTVAEPGGGKPKAPDGSRVNRLLDGCEGSRVMEWALQLHCLGYMSVREGREVPMIFSASFTIHWGELHSEALQFP